MYLYMFCYVLCFIRKDHDERRKSLEMKIMKILWLKAKEFYLEEKNIHQGVNMMI